MADYTAFAKWLDGVLDVAVLPKGIEAFNFNLYEASDDEKGDEFYEVLMIGAASYDPDDSDWACDEVFSTGENLFALTADDWEACLADVIGLVKQYLSGGKHAALMTGTRAVAVGFVDGDIEVIWERE